MAQFFKHLECLAAEYELLRSELLQMQNDTLRAALPHELERTSTHRQQLLAKPAEGNNGMTANDSRNHEVSLQHQQHSGDFELSKVGSTDVLASPLPDHTLVAEPIFGGMPKPAFQSPDRAPPSKSPRGSVQSLFLEQRGSVATSAMVEDNQVKVKPSTNQSRPQAPNLGDMKDKVRQALLRESSASNTRSYYKDAGLLQYIARHWAFENIGMMVIAFNALWMAIDADYNNAETLLDTEVHFIVMEQAFCFYFVAELLIHLGALKDKRDCCKLSWFIFDIVLVILLVAETWILNLIMFATSTDTSLTGSGNATTLRLVRVIRLTRLLRMAKLLKKAPELMIMLKALTAAARTVSITLFLLLTILYVAGLGFRSTLKGTHLGNTDFSSVPRSMHLLFAGGAILDNTTELMDKLLQESLVAFFMMYAVIVLCGITVMNMMIGILCEVVSAVASAEHEAIQIAYIKDTLLQRLEASGDANHDGYIDQEEFLHLLGDQLFILALKDIDVDVFGLLDFEEIIFDDAEVDEHGLKKLPLASFLEQLLLLRGSNNATVKDLMSLRKLICKSFSKSITRYSSLMDGVSESIAPQSSGPGLGGKKNDTAGAISKSQGSSGDDDNRRHSGDQSCVAAPIKDPPQNLSDSTEEADPGGDAVFPGLILS